MRRWLGVCCCMRRAGSGEDVGTMKGKDEIRGSLRSAQDDGVNPDHGINEGNGIKSVEMTGATLKRVSE